MDPWPRWLTETRRAHSLAVGRRMESVSHLLPAHLRADAITAAYLHDVGYGYPNTGFHPIDGARLLHSLGYTGIVCHLVAFHTAAAIEAEVRGLDPAIFEPFRLPEVPELPVADDFLWWADLSTGPSGEAYTVDQRLEEILQRYEPGSIVHTAISKAEPLLRSAVQRVAGSI
ncbi:HD domain-containing protein [Nocardia sp. NPDC050193]